MTRLLAPLGALVVVAAACPQPYPRFPQPPACGTTRHEAILAIPPSSLVLSTEDGSLVCIAGQTDECDDAEADCATDIGDVDLGADTLFNLGMNAAPAGGGGVNVTSITFDGPCAPAWYAPSSIAQFGGEFLSGTTTLTPLRLRPIAAGDCDVDVIVESDAGNTPPGDGARMHLHANVVDDGTAGGCRTDNACCCDGAVAPREPACDDAEQIGHLGCSTIGGFLFFDAECGSQQCVPPVQP